MIVLDTERPTRRERTAALERRGIDPTRLMGWTADERRAGRLLARLPQSTMAVPVPGPCGVTWLIVGPA
jgi:hypothetical protein